MSPRSAGSVFGRERFAAAVVFFHCSKFVSRAGHPIYRRDNQEKVGLCKVFGVILFTTTHAPNTPTLLDTTSTISRILSSVDGLISLSSPGRGFSESRYEQRDDSTCEHRRVDGILVFGREVQQSKHTRIEKCSRREGECASRVAESLDQGRGRCIVHLISWMESAG